MKWSLSVNVLIKDNSSGFVLRTWEFVLDTIDVLSPQAWDSHIDSSVIRARQGASLFILPVHLGFPSLFYGFNRPFYRYGGHMELIGFKEYYGMPRGYEHDPEYSRQYVRGLFGPIFFFKFS